ncbi:hypothetical protein BJ912DRAFT_1071343 [Pholiota molesta]|nr:hypothetical protein BJ912DRAFT_1071343 [Pholiota molesta]
MSSTHPTISMTDPNALVDDATRLEAEEKEEERMRKMVERIEDLGTEDILDEDERARRNVRAELDLGLDNPELDADDRRARARNIDDYSAIPNDAVAAVSMVSMMSFLPSSMSAFRDLHVAVRKPHDVDDVAEGLASVESGSRVSFIASWSSRRRVHVERHAAVLQELGDVFQAERDDANVGLARELVKDEYGVEALEQLCLSTLAATASVQANKFKRNGSFWTLLCCMISSQTTFKFTEL